MDPLLNYNPKRFGVGGKYCVVASLEYLLLSVVLAENHRDDLHLRSGLCSGLNACHVLANHILSATLTTFFAGRGQSSSLREIKLSRFVV